MESGGATRFQAALKEGKLVGFSCAGCARKQATPMARCIMCGSGRIESCELAREGIVESFTIQNVCAPEFAAEVPYAVAVVRLDDDARVTGWIPSVADPSQLAIGQRVRFAPRPISTLLFEKV